MDIFANALLRKSVDLRKRVAFDRAATKQRPIEWARSFTHPILSPISIV